jgi:pyruvate/2-oxoglutarate dehydrogenase complex dihydrolipoamide dehydrogenase (E3) component
VLIGKRKVGENVIIAGGGSVGAETALYLAMQGKKVTIIEMMKNIAVEVFDESRGQLLRLLTEKGVTVLTEATLIEINSQGVVVETKNGKQLIPAETIVIALGMKSDNRLANALRESGQEFIAIGDCVKPRRIIDAIWEGYRRARTI